MKNTLLIASLFLISNTSFACTCMNLTIEDMVISADSIFLAKLTSTNIPNQTLIVGSEESALYFPFGRNGAGDIEANFELIDIYKGNSISNQLVVLTGTGDFDCSVPLSIGLIYVIFKRDDSEYISTCDGTRVRDLSEENYFINLQAIIKINDVN
jgi:hypothetical protein